MQDGPGNEHIEALLKEVVDHYDQEDRFVRERQIRLWKKLKYYWSGFQRLWWSETAHDWRVFDANLIAESNQNDSASFYDKPINIFRAYLESIIAALSVTTPSIKCFPDDADNSLDIETAKAGDKIADLVAKHNDATFLWIHALFIYCTEGMVAAYSYPKEDYAYGSYNEEKKEDTEEVQPFQYCPNCGTEIGPSDSTSAQGANQESDEIEDEYQDKYMPDDDDVEATDLLDEAAKQGTSLCPKCASQVIPELRDKTVIVTRIVGITTKPKTRQCIEVYGGLYVKVPNYAKNQADCPYLIQSYETHYALAIERYPKLRDKLTGQNKIGPGSGGIYDPYERWGRLSTQYFGEYPINVTTVRNSWLRPAAFNILNSEDDVNLLKKHFPDGAKVVLVNDTFAEAENECLDDCWTLTQNPLSDYIHYDPIGMLLTSVQEITNDLISLTTQTIEHGIPQTFASPDVVNFDQYSQLEATPGMIIPTRPSTGKALGDGFYTTKTAMLSGEVLPFAEKIQEAGQLVSGALPSLFGGNQANSSKTAAQYAMSKNQAMQRLQTPWKMLNIWWKNIFGKVIPAYIKDVKEDEHFVDKDASGNFVNVFVRRAEIGGKIGSVELESSDQLPSTWAQKKDVIMQLLQGGNPDMMMALMSPENLPLLQQALGLDDFDIPGSDDRQKQYEEIKMLLASEPLPDVLAFTNQSGQVQDPNNPPEAPSVDIDPLVDNHQIEADICKRWAVSDAGRLAKVENPNGYKNVLLHMKRHIDIMHAMAPQAPLPQGGQPNPNGNNGSPNPVAEQLPQGASNASVQ